jgi:hypothetical protein
MIYDTNMNDTNMNDKALLAEAKALVMQLFVRGDYQRGGTTEKQCQALVDRINKSLYGN